jgi:hypothetical protein
MNKLALRHLRPILHDVAIAPVLEQVLSHFGIARARFVRHLLDSDQIVSTGFAARERPSLIKLLRTRKGRTLTIARNEPIQGCIRRKIPLSGPHPGHTVIVEGDQSFPNQLDRTHPSRMDRSGCSP